MILAESGAIVDYMTEHFGQWMMPPKYLEGKEGEIGAETEEWIQYRYFMHYVEGSYMPILLLSLMTLSKLSSSFRFFLFV